MHEFMKKILTKVFLVLILSLAFSEVALAVPILNPDNGHYYDAYSGSGPWHSAEHLAEATQYLGVTGHLATLTTQAENEWVKSYFVGFFYVGGTDEGTEGKWRWVTGEPWSYVNWFPGEPSNSYGAEHYLVLYPDGRWNDYFASGFNGAFIIEYDVSYPTSAVPEPSTLFLVTSGMAGLGLIGIFRKRLHSFIG